MPYREVLISNRLGLHARAAAEVVKLVNQFEASIELRVGGQKANARSVMELLMLGAPVGTHVEIFTEGIDEEQTMLAMVGLIENRFNELE